jgi:hypothetical protein
MVYELLPIVTRHSTICMTYTHKYNGSSTLVQRLLPLSILRVCKMIYHEAYAMLKHKMIEIIAHPPQIIIPSTDLSWMRDGFARFLHVLEVTYHLPGPATIQSDATTPVQVSPVWAAALREGNIPAVANPSLVQWTQQANLYLQQTPSPLSLTKATANSSSVLQRDTGIQLLIRSTESIYRCYWCNQNHRVLRYALAKFLERNLTGSEGDPRVEVSLLDPALNDSADDCLPVYTVDKLRKHLAGAFDDMDNMYEMALHAYSGEVVEREAWDEHWRQSRDRRVAGFWEL